MKKYKTHKQTQQNKNNRNYKIQEKTSKMKIKSQKGNSFYKTTLS